MLSHPSNNVILIGFMGAGKSTVGRSLAKYLTYTFIDTDTLIETSSGKTIKELFGISEAYFRSWEFQISKSLQSSKQSVISTGGGMLMVEKTALLLKKLGSLIYLKSSAKTLYERVKHSTHRPLLDASNPLEIIESMLKTRHKTYASYADLILECDNCSVDDILNMILSNYDFT